MRNRHFHRRPPVQARVAAFPNHPASDAFPVLDELAKWALRLVVTGYAVYGAYLAAAKVFFIS